VYDTASIIIIRLTTCAEDEASLSFIGHVTRHDTNRYGHFTVWSLR